MMLTRSEVVQVLKEGVLILVFLAVALTLAIGLGGFGN